MIRVKPIYEDNHLLVLSKPAGMPTVPDSSGDHSLLDWGKHYLKKTRNKPGNVFLGVVHRLDRPVSGLVCFAITSKAASRLSAQMREHKILKTYLGISHTRPANSRRLLEHFILKDARVNKVQVFEKGGRRPGRAKLAKTMMEHLSSRQGYSLLLLRPETGRPHQIRAQLAKTGCILAGDVKYGAARPIKDQSVCLHAAILELTHPTTRERLKFTLLPPRIFPWTLFWDRTLASALLLTGTAFQKKLSEKTGTQKGRVFHP